MPILYAFTRTDVRCKDGFFLRNTGIAQSVVSISKRDHSSKSKFASLVPEYILEGAAFEGENLLLL